MKMQNINKKTEQDVAREAVWIASLVWKMQHNTDPRIHVYTGVMI